MQHARIGLISLLLSGMILMSTAFTNAVPQMALALVEGRTHDQGHDSGYIDWGGPVQYVYIFHRDETYLPVEEGSIYCGAGCWEWVTRIESSGTVSGSFDRDVSYFEVMAALSHDANVGNATLQACSSVRTANMYRALGGGAPGFVTIELSVPAGCRSWSLTASGGYVDFRATEVIYSTPPSPPTSTGTPLPSVTPSITSTPTLTATSTNTATPTFTPTTTATPSLTPTNTPSPTPTPLPPEIVGQVVCDVWGDAGWCKGKESLELMASDPQGFDVAISGDLNGNPLSCGASCNVSLPEGVGTANYLVTSTSGKTASRYSTWQRDSTPPALNIIVPSVDRRNEWYDSEVDFTANASDAISGLVSIAGSIDNGVTWNSFPIHLADGVYSVAAYARDIAGNDVIENTIIQIDTIPPVSQFTSHENGQAVQGNVMLSGKLEDLTSGIASGELSLDGGTTWQVVSLSAANTWSFAWNTGEVINGQYQLQMRGIDQAGNVGEAASVILVVDNRPPHVSLTDHWWIWESGQLKVSPNYLPVARVRVIISDPQRRWSQVVLNFNPEKVQDLISWDRHFADGTLAPSGWYRVLAVACDMRDLCDSDEGIVEIPSGATSTTTLTPSPTMTITLTPRATLTAVQKPFTPTLIFAVPSPSITPDSTQPAHSMLFWQLLVLLGLFLAIASASIIDPRPPALDRLRQSINSIFNQQKDLLDNNK